MEDNKIKESIISATAKDYDMAIWKVEEIYQNYYPDKFYQKLEEALKERETLNDCEW